MIEVSIVADSVNTSGDRLTSFLLKYPRFIHSEFLTHRLFSRNASSSRARPSVHMITEAENDFVLPMFWGKNQKGMQSFQELEQDKVVEAEKSWNRARLAVIEEVKYLTSLGLHKQYANRLLEPFTHITIICTATEYGNFFNLRADKDAMPEIEELAFLMLKNYEDSVPILKQPGEWHLPFADKYVDEGLSNNELLKIVTARAARLSYLNFEGNIDHEKDYKLHDDLTSNGHWSPFEHPAQALEQSQQSGNFIGWKQYRKFFHTEHRRNYNANQLFKERGR